MSYAHGRFEDALFQQTQQLRFLESEKGASYMGAFQSDWTEKRRAQYPPGWLHTLTTESLRRADPIYVSPDVTEIIDVAMEKFEPEPILPSDPFVPCGFAYLPRSIRRPDRQGRENGIRAISWLPITDKGTIASEDGPGWVGIWMSFFSHESDPNGEEYLNYRELSPLFELQYLHGTFVRFESPEWEPKEEQMVGLDPEKVMASARDQWVLPQVMWRIGQQLVPTQERPSRNVRRDAQRHGVLQDEVSVLRLRRSKVKFDGEGEEGNYDHRWLVSGHWRKQPYPSWGEGVTRQIWINPYCKGPEGKPLIVKDRAVEFTR